MSIKNKLLLITPYIPYPLFEGGRIAQYGVIDSMRFSFEITLILTVKSDEDANNICELKSLWQNVTFEVINLIPAEQEESLKQKVKRILKNLYHILSGKNKKHAQANVYSEFENSFFINLEVAKSKTFLLQLDEIIKRTAFDLVEIDFVDFIDLVHCFPAEIPKVFVQIEIRFARLQTYLETLGRLPDAYEHYILKKVTAEELNFLRLYNGVITMSNDDKKKLDKFLPADFVFSSPFPVLDNHFLETDTDTLSIDKLILLGGEDHYPNKDSFEWFVNEVQPAMPKYAHLPVHVVGRWTNETKELYKNKTNVHFAGFVEDLLTYCKNSILVVPIRIGSGIRTKIMYGMAQGMPVITTSVGCEGLPVRDKTNIWIANSAEEFENAIETIFVNPATAIKVIQAGQELIKEHFSQKAVAELRGSYFKKLISGAGGLK